MRTKLISRSIAAGALALSVGPALALVVNPPPASTVFEDDNIDFLFEVSGATLVPKTSGSIEVGDVLIAAIEFNDDAGGPITGEELTAISVIQVESIDPGAPSGVGDVLNFGPYSGGFNAAIAAAGGSASVPYGGAGEGAMVALWLDPTPNLVIDAGSLPNFSCLDGIEVCLDQASDGALYQVDGFLDPTDRGDNYWFSTITLPGGADVTTVAALSPTVVPATFQAGLDVLEGAGGTGQLPGLLGGPVDVLISGTVGGGGRNATNDPTDLLAGLAADGYFATSDAQLEKVIPVPATLLLLGAGLLGLRWSMGRRQA